MYPPTQIQLQVRIKMWVCLPATICMLQSIKRSLCWAHETQQRHGANYSLIVNAACFFEGILESGLGELKEKKSKSLPNELPESLKKKLRNNVGLRHYDGLFELLTGKGFGKTPTLAPFFEGLDALFAMRNVLAHGRAATFSYQSKLGDGGVECIPENQEMEGAYPKTQEYLIKKKLLSVEESKGVTMHTFLKDQIAEHFVLLTLDAIISVMKSLEKSDLETFEKATGPTDEVTRFRDQYFRLTQNEPEFSVVTHITRSPGRMKLPSTYPTK